MAIQCHIPVPLKQCPDMLACSALGMAGEGYSTVYMFNQSPAGCSRVLQPGSPLLADVRCNGYGSLSSRMEADVKLLSGSKRSCEGSHSLQDEAEADDCSMVSRGSQLMCRSGSVRSFGIKRVCSIASADGIDSHCMAQPQGSIMIPVPGSCSNLQGAAGAASPGGMAASAPAKRSSKTGSSISSQEQNGQTAAAAAAGQEAASGGPLGNGRKLAPIKTSVPRGPRLRLNGRLLSPEEAQKHLQAVAAAAAAASAGRSLSRAQSPAVTCPGGTSIPAGPYSSSMSLSAGAPCNSVGNSSGMCGPTAFKPAFTAGTAAAAAAAAASADGFTKPAAAAAPGAQFKRTQIVSALDVLPENFIPTPEGVSTWHTLASTLEDGCGTTSSGGCRSPLVCSSYTELLLAEEADASVPPSAAAARASDASFTPHNGASFSLPPAAAPSRLSAFAVHSAVPWPAQQQAQQAAGPLLLASAGSVSNQTTAGGVPLGSTCPVHIPTHSSSWTSSKLLNGSSVTGSNGSTGNTLASSLAAQGSSAATETSFGGLLGSWGAPQQQQQQFQALAQAQCVPQQPQGMVAFSAGAGGSAGPASWGPGVNGAAGNSGAAPAWKPAFSSAFAPSGNSAALADASSSMVPTPGLSAVGSTPVLTLLPQQQQQQHGQLTRTKSTSSRCKRHSKPGAGLKASKSSLQLQANAQQAQQMQLQPEAVPQLQQQAQQMLVLNADGGQVVLSQQDLMAVLQQNMAASFASGYMMASSMQGGQPAGPPQLQMQLPGKPPLLKPVASIGAFVMPPGAADACGAATAGAANMPVLTVSAGGVGPAAGGVGSTAAAAAALGSSSDMARLVGSSGVDDILPSLQELLTDCY